GWFFRKWHDEGIPARRIKVTWRQCPRHSPEFIDRERREHGDGWVAQEYECQFTTLEGLVYPDFARALLDAWPGPRGKPVGGIDFGWRNPFAALWGVHDGDDVLWIAGERYLRETLLSDHAECLRPHKAVMWFADSAHPTEINELRVAGFCVRKAD